MSDIAKGGRGRKAPYESTHYRIPLPLKPIVEQMAADYRELVELVDDPAAPGVIAAVITATAARLDNDDQDIPVTNQDVVLNVLSKFIELQQSEYGKNVAQKNKLFSMDTRGWDYFKKFMTTVKENPDILGL